MAPGEGWDLELPFVQATGQRIWVRAVGAAELESGKPVRLVGAFQDVTALRNVTAELAKQHERLRVTLQSIGDAVITTDASGTVTWLNPVAERMTDWLSAEAKGHPTGQVFHIVNEETPAPTENPVATCLQQGEDSGLGQTHRADLARRRRVRHRRFGFAHPQRARRDPGRCAGLPRRDRGALPERRDELPRHARCADGAGQPHRVRDPAAPHIEQGAHEDSSEHALLFIDLDQFKLVNDACGHSVGDQLLQQVSKLLGETVRVRDTLARPGGDEFAVILEHCSADQAQRVTQKICERMDNFRFIQDERRFRIGPSIGLVPVDNRWGTTAAVLQAADTSCYAAKEAGRNRVHAWFDTDQAVRARHGEIRWAARLEQALDENRFALYAQRTHALDQQTHGLHVEVLLRMIETDGSVVQPGAFLPAAERFHFASRIDRWVLHHATDALTEAGAEIYGRLCVEITETAAVTNMADASVFIDQVRALGVRLALDDAAVRCFVDVARVAWAPLANQECARRDRPRVQN